MSNDQYHLLRGVSVQLHLQKDHPREEINDAVFAKMTPFVLLFVKMSTALFCYKGTLLSSVRYIYNLEF